MNDLKQLYNSFKHIRFFEEGHKYINLNTKQQYTSVTTKIKEFTESFRSDYWATFKTAEGLGHEVKSDASKGIQKGYIQLDGDLVYYKELQKVISKDVISMRESWRYKARLGTTKGTITHKYLEDLWSGKVTTYNADLSFIKDQELFEESLGKMITNAESFYDDFSKKYLPIKLELVLGHDKYKIAGQCDALFYDMEHDEYVLCDYKTDKKFEQSNRFQRFKKPLEQYEECEYNKYSIQLSMYKKIIEDNSDIKISEMIIVWLNDKLDNYKLFYMPYIDITELLTWDQQ